MTLQSPGSKMVLGIAGYKYAAQAVLKWVPCLVLHATQTAEMVGHAQDGKMW